MDNKITFEEIKANIKLLWQLMEPKCVMKNLKNILEFLQGPLEEICFVNMPEKYLPFYYMMVIDNDFLKTMFITDECKVLFSEILQTLESNRNSFTWEVCFSEQVVGIPVIFRKVYTQPYQSDLIQNYEKSMCSIIEETWIKETLKFIKSSSLVLQYPEMTRQKALHLYRGILKLNKEDLGSDSPWVPVWEALNIFKFRYEYIISLYSTSLDYLKVVHFQKVPLRRKIFAIENMSRIIPIDSNESKSYSDTKSDKNKASNNYGDNKDESFPVINHNELVKTLLEEKVSNSDTLTYTLRLNEPNITTTSIINEFQAEDSQSSAKDDLINLLALSEYKALITATSTDLSKDLKLDDYNNSSIPILNGLPDKINPLCNKENLINLSPLAESAAVISETKSEFREDLKLNEPKVTKTPIIYELKDDVNASSVNNNVISLSHLIENETVMSATLCDLPEDLTLNEPNMHSFPVMNGFQNKIYLSSDKDKINLSPLTDNKIVTTATISDLPRDLKQIEPYMSKIQAEHNQLSDKGKAINLLLEDQYMADVNLNIEVKDETMVNIKRPNIVAEVNVMLSNKSDLGCLQKTTMLIDNNTNYQNITIWSADVKVPEFEYFENKDAKVMDFEKNLVNNGVEDLKVTVANSLVEHDQNYDKLANKTVVDNCSTQMNLSQESDETQSVTENPFLQQITKLQVKTKLNHPVFVKEEDFMRDGTIHKDTINEVSINENKIKLINATTHYEPIETDDIFRNAFKKLRSVKKTVKNPSKKSQKRQGTKIRQKLALINDLNTKFILTSFKAICDFIEDDLRATMEMISLNLQEANFLTKLHGYSPNTVPVKEIFDKTCVELVIQLFDSLNNKQDYCLEITLVKPDKAQKHISAHGPRQYAVVLTKRPFKKSRTVISSNAQNVDTGSQKYFEELTIPKSTLEKLCLVPPMRAESPGRSSVSSEEHKVSRNLSVSPVSSQESPARLKGSRARSKVSRARSKVSRARSKVSRARSKESPARSLASSERSSASTDLHEHLSEKPSRPLPPMPAKNPAVSMKAKLLEGLASPLESDKAMRMMRLMGWNGGALGVRGDGLIEPIQPQLDVPKGVGLGHKNFKSTKHNSGKLQRKIKRNKTTSVEINKTDKNSSKSNESNEDVENNNFITDDKKLDTFQINDNNNAISENESVSPNEALSDLSDKCKMKFKRETDTKKNIEGTNWLTNESLWHKIKNTHTSNNVNDRMAKSEMGKRKENETLIDKSGLLIDEVIQRNRDTVRANHDKLMNSLKKMNIEKLAQYRVIRDEELDSYIQEKRTKYLGHCNQFLVHLLDLLQSDEKSFTVVSFVEKASQECINFMDSCILSLNQREKPPSTLLWERTILDACSREMAAHDHLLTSYHLKKKLWILCKINNSLKSCALPPDMACEEYENLETTHYVYNYENCRQIPQEANKKTRIKFFTNTVVLEFIKSGDVERVYEYGRTPANIRSYVTSLVSLLNRQMAHYQLGLGNSEHPIFREMLSEMKNFCLLFRFDTQKSVFNKLQLVKIDLTKKCRVCQLPNITTNSSDNYGTPHEIDDENSEDIDDIDLYPNKFNKNDSDSSDNNEIIDKSFVRSKLNEENVDKAYDTDCEDEKQYLIGEDWLLSDENNGTSAKNESYKNTDMDTNKNSEVVLANITENDVRN